MELIKLVWYENRKDKDGFEEKKYCNIIEACAEEKSVVRQEAYESMRAGISVKTVLEIRQEDWEETRHMVDGKPEYAEKVQFDGWEYDIVRTFKTGKAKIELVCG